MFIVKSINLDDVFVIKRFAYRNFMFEVRDLAFVRTLFLQQDFQRDASSLARFKSFPNLGRIAGANQPQQLVGTDKVTYCAHNKLPNWN